MPWSVAFMVVAIVLVVMIASVSKARYRAMEKGARVGELPQPNAVSPDEIAKLKQRIQVLERVITDDRKSIDLDREIERLR